MPRYVVQETRAYGRITFRVIDLHESGQAAYVVARCDTAAAAHRIAHEFNLNPLS